MRDSNIKQPKIGKFLLKKFTGDENKFAVMGDFEEEYADIKRNKSPFKARLWYWNHLLKSFHSILLNKLIWSIIMFKNYFKLSFRNLKKHKGFSFINIFGLAVGLACCILILFWIQDELSFDMFHTNADRICRVAIEQFYSGGKSLITYSTPAPLTPLMRQNFPSINKYARVDIWDNKVIKSGAKSFNDDRIYLTDAEFFRIFTFPFVHGSPEFPFEDLNSIVITENISKKYFGEENPVGKVLNIDNKADLKISGVIKAPPKNSQLDFDMVIPFKLLETIEDRNLNDFSFNAYRSYILLADNIRYNELQESINDYTKNNTDFEHKIHLQPITRMHLYPLDGENRIKYVYIFSIIAGFVLMIACINFINLTTARSANRTREVGMRKVFGGYRKELMMQFFSESLMYVFIALMAALIFIKLLLPVFNGISGKELTWDFILNKTVLLGLFFVVLLTALLSGSYPSFYRSSFKPVRVLQLKTVTFSKAGFNLRKILVIIQFTISVFLIILTIIISNQLNYMQNKELGYDREHVLYIPINDVIKEKYDVIKTELLKNPDILNISASLNIPTNISATAGGMKWKGKSPEDNILINFELVDYDYFETLNMDILQGRSFSKEFTADAEGNFIINETLAKIIGIDNPVGSEFSFFGKAKIVGVVKDFHFQSLHNKIKPLVFKFFSTHWARNMLINIRGDNLTSTITNIENRWKTLNPDIPLEYHFLDEAFDRLYRTEQKFGRLFNYFAALALSIACLGIFGLAAYTAQQKTKEIGIRKALGAKIPDIVKLLSKEFIILVLIANILAWPLGYYAMNKWLENFEYKTDISIFIFIISGIIAVFVTIFTVSYQTIKAARTNPVKSLRYE